MDRLNLCRLRVIEFENELEKSIAELGTVEEEILLVGKLRKNWLDTISSFNDIDGQKFKKRLSLLRTKADISSLQLQLDILKLESLFETQTVVYLQEATKPQENGESLEMRTKLLNGLIRDNLEALKLSTRASIEFRSHLATESHEHTLEISKHKIDYSSQHELLIRNLKERICEYLHTVTDSAKKSRDSHKKITCDYLVLRHNARVAREVLLRSQNEASTVRHELQESLARFTEDAKQQSLRMEASAAAELNILTQDVRTEVMQKEKELEDLQLQTDKLLKRRKKETSLLKRELRTHNDKYDDLQQKRQTDLRSITEELKRLRTMIAAVEARLYSREPPSTHE